MTEPAAIAKGLGHRCPQCGAPVKRVHRHRADRLVGLLRSVHRYRCTSTACGWEGLLHRLTVDPRGHVLRVGFWWFVIGALAALSAAYGLQQLRAKRIGPVPPRVALGGAEQLSLATPPGESFDGEPLPTHDERTLGNRTPLLMRNSCAWGVPGRNPYRGNVMQALYAAQLPSEVVRQIADHAERGWSHAQVAITRDGIRTLDGRQQWGNRLQSMAFGNALCFNTRVNFAPGHVEHAALYSADDHQGRTYHVIVPYVCQNVAVLGERGGNGEHHENPEPPAWALVAAAGLAAWAWRGRRRPA